MVTIEKLQIQGIRSFGDDEEGKQTITFNKPVTLILGENGCGKSTIIECLRYVTTGKEPTGKSVFVRDPELCSGGLTVKASVKIRLRNGQDHAIHLMRALQATRRGNGITQKTLDATISVAKPGESQVSISSRCADTAAETIRLLGVSKAILENVIFCSQEDSFWPLETDKALKEKFDQIFDSEKYNKCLKRVKDLHKALKGKKGELEQNTAYNKEKKTAAEGKRRVINKINKDIEKFKKQQEDFDEKLNPMYDELKSINEQEKKVAKIYTDQETTKTMIAAFQREETELRTRLQDNEFLGSTEELELALDELNMQNKDVDTLNREMAFLKRQEVKLNTDISKGLSRVGELKKTVEINNKKIAEKEKKLQEIANQCRVTASTEAVSSYVNKKKQDLVELQTEHERAENDKASKLNKSRDDYVATEMEVRRKEETLTENQREIDEIMQDLQSVGESQARREQLVTELRAAEKQLKDHEKSCDSGKMQLELNLLQTQAKKAGVELAEADREFKLLEVHADKGRDLEYHSADLDKKKTEMRRIIDRHRDTFTSVLGFTPESNFKHVVEKHSEKLSSEVKELNKQKADREGMRMSLLNNVKSITLELRKKNGEWEAFRDEVFETTQGGELDETLNATKIKVDGYQREKGDLEAASHMYKSYISSLKTKACCPLCRRDFAAEEAARALVEELESKMKQVPSRITQVVRDLEDKKVFLRKLYDLESLQKKMNSVKLEEIPALNSEEKQKKVEIAKASADLEEINQKLDRIESSRKMCTTILGDMALIDQHQKAIEGLSAIIQRIQQVLPAGWSKEALKDAQQRRDKLSEELKVIEGKKNNLQWEFNAYNEQLLKLQNNKHGIAERELALRSKDGQQKSQEDRLVTLRSQQAVILQDLQAAKDHVKPLKDVHRRVMEELNDLKERNKSALRAEQKRLDEIVTQFRDVQRLEREIADFERQEDSMKLQTLESDIAANNALLENTKIKIESVNLKLGDLAKIEVRRHNLEDNKALREKIRKREDLQKKLKEMTESFGNDAYNALIKRKRHLQAEELKINQEKANIAGQVGVLEGQVKSIVNELNSTMYKDIDKRYFEALVTQKVTEAQAGDLHRYGEAMEYAMGKYHNEAMKQVNSHIKEYWTRIYRGNDIDYIQIQAQQAQSTGTRTTFNYRLVQIKNEASIDMRNRCSAGQKMLACLIVRMALAEVFSNNCGILTLDEPTTNLDKKNVSMLAEALNELIATKSGFANTNFQLVIITHDKDFLRQIIASQAVEQFIQVKRSFNGTSEVTTLSVNDNM